MAPSRLAAVLGLLIALALSLLAISCNGNDAPDPTPTSEATSAPTVALPATRAPTNDPCSGGSGPVATAAHEVAVNADGDGTPDSLGVVGGSPVSVHVTLDYRVAFGLQLSVNAPEAEAIGGFDVDGDGRQELFAKTGSGAYTTWIDVFEYDENTCALVRLAVPGQPLPQFLAGASVRNGAGLRCADGLLQRIDFTSGDAEPITYTGTKTSYRIAGDHLELVRQEPLRFGVDDEQLMASFDCGNLQLH